jgi:hypothetical protein
MDAGFLLSAADFNFLQYMSEPKNVRNAKRALPDVAC